MPREVDSGGGRRDVSSAQAEREAAARHDRQLMQRFAKGDATAFEALLQRHKKPLYNFCFRMLGERTAAEDATQDVFLKVIRGAEKWESQAKFSTWLYTIARNHCIDGLRKARYRKTTSLDQPLDHEEGAALGDRVPDGTVAGSTDRAAHSLRLRGHLAQAIASLSEEQREVFVMREYAGMPFKEIADVVGVSENTVKSRMRYALQRLRGLLSEAGFAPTRE